MTKKPSKSTQKKKSSNKIAKSFVAKIANFSGKSGRKHIEVPKEKRKLFKSGDPVKVDPIE
jgi:hypothetical protein